MKQYLYCLALGLVMVGCTAAPKRQIALETRQTPPAASLVRLLPSEYPELSDDGNAAALQAAARESASYFRSQPSDQLYRLGRDTYTAVDMAETAELVASLSEHTRSAQEWSDVVKQQFIVYQSVGSDAKRTVTFSSYYEPTISARLQRDSHYRFPLVGRPNDLVDVDLSLFDLNWQGQRVSGRRLDRALVPYYTRAEIDSDNNVNRETIAVAWAADPLDIFFLQIEGSGWLDLGPSGTGDGNQKLRIRYDGDNGRRYRSVGQYMIREGLVRAKGFDHDALVRYMAKHPRKRQALLNINERYVFFKVDTSTSSSRAFGNIGVPLTAGRSIATDPRLFPKGGVAWIQTRQSKFNRKGKVAGTKPLARWMLTQDEGGAILGPGRVDYFAGDGPDAEQFATHFWYTGQLFYLVRKK